MHTMHDKQKRPITNNFYLYQNEGQSIGTAYLIHGYGGSPIDPTMKNFADAANRNHFDVVAIESHDLSISSEPFQSKARNLININRYRRSIIRGLNESLKNPRLNHSYRICVTHSLSSLAIMENILRSEMTRTKFNDFVFAIPYLFLSPKVSQKKAEFLSRDPSGRTWERFRNMPKINEFKLDGQTYTFPLYASPFENQFLSQFQNLSDRDSRAAQITQIFSAYKLSDRIKDKGAFFIYGTEDNTVDSALHDEFYEILPIVKKSKIMVDGLDHICAQGAEQFCKVIDYIFKNIAEAIKT